MGIVDGVTPHECVVQWAGVGYGVVRMHAGHFLACHAGARGGVRVYPSVEVAERAMALGRAPWRPFRRRMDSDAQVVELACAVVSSGGGVVHPLRALITAPV